jgi:signal transduction histidine kinase
MGVFFAWLITSSLYLLPFRPGVIKDLKWLEKVHFSYYFFGIFYAVTLTHFLGGGEWIAPLAYFFDLVYANVLMRRPKGAIITALIMLSYFVLVILEYWGILPHYDVFPPAGRGYDKFSFVVVTNILMMGMIFGLISYSTGLFSRMKEKREKDLIESKKRFSDKSEQLERMMRKIRKKIAENTYIKRAAMGFIEKKEFELQKTNKDLEQQIMKLRKTQRSMLFMIQDLNDMSSQLKEAKGDLEDKVRARSEELINISRKLNRSEKLAFMGRLAGSVTHELKNPLAVLKNAIYVLGTKLKDSDDEKVSHYIKVIEKEIMLVDSIIEDIMGFAKTKAPELEETDLADIINRIVSNINAPDTVRIQIDFREAPEVKIDSRQISHAFVNIINNAIIAMNGNGTLTFRIYPAGGEVCVEISDTGPGIPAEHRDLIFEPLYSSKPKGTGLGLPIAKMMIENSNGRIEFDSGLEKGTVFRIYFLKK